MVAQRVAIYPQTAQLPEPEPHARTYRVQPGDSLGEIAATQLGDSERWVDIWRANKDRLQAAGLPPDARPEIGWTLALPSLQREDGPNPDERQPAPRPPDQTTRVAYVEPGENLWTISEGQLAEQLDREPTDAETAPYWQQTVDLNLPTLNSGDPDLIYPGEQIALPPTVGNVDETTVDEEAQPEVAPPPIPQPPTTTPATPSTTPTTSPAPTTGTTGAPTAPEQTPPTAHDTGSKDDDNPRGIPTVLIPAGVSAALAAVTLRALARRRRARRRSAKPGTTSGPRPAEDIETELALSAASSDVLQRAWTAASKLSEPLTTTTPPPTPTGFLVQADGDVTIYMQEPNPAVPPFVQNAADPSTWRLPASEAQDPPPDDTVPILETLVALGHTDSGDWLFVDLESLGAIWIDGDRDHARTLAQSLVAELALQPLNHYLSITTVGDLQAPGIVEQGIESPWVGWRLLTLETRMESWGTNGRLGSRRRVGTRRRRRSRRCAWSASSEPRRVCVMGRSSGWRRSWAMASSRCASG